MLNLINDLNHGKDEKEEIDIREKLFRMLLMVGSVLCVVGIAEGAVIGYEPSMYSILSFLTLGLVVSLLLTFRYRKYRLAAGVLAVVLSVCVFPAIMLDGGGVSSGSTMWAIITIFFVFTFP